MKKLVIYKCNHCGNVCIKLVDKKVPLYCCGEQMKIIEAKRVEGLGEKHIPVLTQNGNAYTVKVGSITHPMLEEHLISHIILITKNNLMLIKELKSNEEPIATFTLNEDDEVESVYSYCNIHGLWQI